MNSVTGNFSVKPTVQLAGLSTGIVIEVTSAFTSRGKTSVNSVKNDG